MRTDHLSLQTEIAPAKHRGFVVGLTQQMIGIGFIVANWVSRTVGGPSSVLSILPTYRLDTDANIWTATNNGGYL